MAQQHASVSQVMICSDNFTCCYTEIEVADSTFYLTQSQYTDSGPSSPSADPITPGAWYDSTPIKSRRKRDSNPGSSALETDALPQGQRGGRKQRRREDRRSSWRNKTTTATRPTSWLVLPPHLPVWVWVVLDGHWEAEPSCD